MENKSEDSVPAVSTVSTVPYSYTVSAVPYSYTVSVISTASTHDLNTIKEDKNIDIVDSDDDYVENRIIQGILEYVMWSKWINYGLAAGFIGLGIWAIIVGKNNHHDDCFKNSNVGKLDLSVALIVFGAVSIIFGSGAWIINRKKFKGESVNRKETGYFSIFILIWIILFGITLFSSTCKADNMSLYKPSLILFIYFLTAGTAASCILCFCGINIGAKTTTAIVLDDHFNRRMQFDNIEI